MSLYAVWPTFLCTIVLLLLASTRVFAAADSPATSEQRRVRTLDGLRGFLALAVFFHHAIIYRKFLEQRIWETPESLFYRGMGPFGVSMFFMITGYLFWGKLIKDHGRPDWLSLYVGRVFRIGPLYLAAVAAMLLVVFERTHFHLQTAYSQLAHELWGWLSLGMIYGAHTVNGYPNANILMAGVTWSIHFEWLFYALLPVLGLACRRPKVHLGFAAVALVFCLVRVFFQPTHEGVPPFAVMGAEFGFGLLTASLLSLGKSLRPNNIVSSVVVCALFSTYFFFSDPYSWCPILLLGVAFYLIASGTTLFGLLVSRPAIRCGDVSYGIYLLQGLALAATLWPLKRFALTSPMDYWLCVLAAGTLLLALATLAHVYVERPGVALGRQVASLLKQRFIRV